ncbi:YhcH/YjgK/YiaL family protein, partial [Neisseria sp. P0014.S008]
KFALFFPNYAHAPLVSDDKSIRKAVFKILIEA